MIIGNKLAFTSDSLPQQRDAHVLVFVPPCSRLRSLDIRHEIPSS